MRTAVIAVAAACCAASLAACGGGESLTYPQFQREATGACLRYHRALAKLGAPSTLPRIVRVAHGAYRLGNVERGELEQLPPPHDARTSFKQMLDGFAQADALLPAVWRAAGKGNVAVAKQLVRQGRALVARANRAALAIGLSDCRRS